jgi:hypothetical protein
MVDQKAKAGMFVLIIIVGMNRPYLEQQDELYRIEDECSEKTGIPLAHIGHAFGTINMLTFQWPLDGDAGAIERGIEAFQQAHPGFEIKFYDKPFQFA